MRVVQTAKTDLAVVSENPISSVVPIIGGFDIGGQQDPAKQHT